MASVTKDLTVSISSGEDVTVEVTVSAYNERHYGADADGRRGESAWFIDDVSFEIPNCDNSNNTLSQDEKNEVEKLIDEKVNEESWNFDE